MAFASCSMSFQSLILSHPWTYLQFRRVSQREKGLQHQQDTHQHIVDIVASTLQRHEPRKTEPVTTFKTNAKEDERERKKPRENQSAGLYLQPRVTSKNTSCLKDSKSMTPRCLLLPFQIQQSILEQLPKDLSISTRK